MRHRDQCRPRLARRRTATTYHTARPSSMASVTRLNPSVWNPVSSVWSRIGGEMASAEQHVAYLIPSGPAPRRSSWADGSARLRPGAHHPTGDRDSDALRHDASGTVGLDAQHAGVSHRGAVLDPGRELHAVPGSERHVAGIGVEDDRPRDAAPAPCE